MKSIKIIYKLKNILVSILLFSFISVVLHNFVHNSYSHLHDSSCSVYVLEQLYFSGDVIESSALLILFLPFLFLVFHSRYVCLRVEKHFPIRAPPIV